MTRATGRRPAPTPADSVDGAHGRAELLRDADRRAAWMLLVDGVPQSHVDLDDPGYLDFEYVRRLGHVIDTARAGGSAHAGAAPGRRGADPGPVRDGDPAGLDTAGRRGRRRAGGPGPAQAAAARGPGPDRRRPDGARAAAGRLVRRGDRGRVRRGADPGPSNLGRVHDGRSACHARRRGIRRQRGRRGAAGPRPGAGRDGASGLPAGGAHRRRGSAARPEVRESGPGGEPGAAAGRRADPADGRGSDAGPGVVRRGPEPVRGRGQAGHRRERPPLPRAAGRRLRGVSGAAKCARPTPSRC